MFDYKLALMTGIDIPIPELQVVLHQPTIKEISMLGEQEFFIGVQLLCLRKEVYIQDEALLNSTTNFQIFITLMNEPQMADKKESVIQVMYLILPDYKIFFTPRSMMLKKGEEIITISEENFQFLQEILTQQFCIKGTDQDQFNPQSEKAREIARKLMKARQRVAEQKAQENSGSTFAQYLSTLTVGLQSMSLSECIDLTMYQLFDLVERYTLYVNWDLDIKAKLAGATDTKPVDNWMKQIH